MAYLDNRDWKSTDQFQAEILRELCAGCNHYRYVHGRAWKPEGPSVIQYQAGACAISACACTSFCEEPPITRDEVLELHDWLRGERTVDDLLATPPRTNFDEAGAS